MHHIAIMNPKVLIDRILSEEKTIETRWYLNRRDPWNKIHTGDTVFFKDSGGLIRAKATVEKVLQFAKRTDLISNGIQPFDANQILKTYGEGIYVENFDPFYASIKDKNYAILIFLKNAIAISPFQIDKTGFGNANAWLCVEDVEKIKV